MLETMSCRGAASQLQIESFMDSKTDVAAAPQTHPDSICRCMGAHPHIAILDGRHRPFLARGLDHRRPHLQVQEPAENNFGFGWEMGRIGAAIASGHGFSDAFGAPTGPTAWEPPLYPYLTAGVFHIFGIYSRASAFVLLSINSIFSALTCIPIFLISRRIFSEKVAVGSAWTWALLPYVMFWCTRWVWETSFSALLLAVISWLALTMQDRDG